MPDFYLAKLPSYLINSLEAASIALQFVLVVRYSLKRSLLRYPLLLAYCLTASLTGLAEYLVQNYGSYEFLVKLYYADEAGVDLLLFLMVITFTYRAMEGNPLRKAAGRVLAGITLFVVVLPFAMYRQAYYNNAGEILNFGAAIMTLVLWTALLGARKRDRQLILVCVGLGLQVTTQTIGFGIREMLRSRHEYRWIPDLFMAAAYLMSILIWWRAFEQPAGSRRIETPVLTADPAAHGAN
ncbi:MAG TPA: hypothetical protein VMG40_20075 [Bryobacteraceae bacterium]|nr:hypothetical protein [Bryobacteraceae bacterium]